ncbi:hypothetical protein A4X06_0g9490, partial [Tilletia controversa]
LSTVHLCRNYPALPARPYPSGRIWQLVQASALEKISNLWRTCTTLMPKS